MLTRLWQIIGFIIIVGLSAIVMFYAVGAPK